MKKYFFILIALFLLLTIGCVNAAEDAISGNATLGDADEISLESTDSNASVQSSKLQTNDLVKYYKNDSHFEFKVLDGKNNPISNAKVLLSVNGRNYTKTTNSKGVGLMEIGLNPGKYKITTFYGNQSKVNSINVLSRLSSKDVTSTYGKLT